MGSLVNPRPWVPYLNIKDCSQGFCSIYCPQWCYTVFPPPPPIDFPSKNRGLIFSPLIFAIIGILASAFLLVSYYAIISKYCNDSSSRRRERHDPNEESEENEDPLTLEPWHVANNGLDDGLIKSIAVCKYKRGHSLFEATDCSVCLSEFGEDESVKLLPKCSHAFHVVCIDTWLKSHSSCPLCRTNIVSISPTPPSLPSPRSESPPNIESVLESTRNEVSLEDIEMGTIRREDTVRNGDVSNEEDKDIVIEIADENTKQIRRSVSMDFDCGQRLSLAEVLLLNQNVDFWDENGCSRNYEVGSSRGKLSKMFKFGNRDGGLHCVNNLVSIKRSFSSGRFSFSKRGRGRNMIIPL